MSKQEMMESEVKNRGREKTQDRRLRRENVFIGTPYWMWNVLFYDEC